MTIARGQMKRQLYQDGTMPEGGLPSLEDIMEGKVSPAEMALIRETLEDEDFISMQEGYNLDSDEMSDEEKRDMEMLMEKQKLPAYQYDEKNPYTGPRDMRMVGGIMRGMKKLLDEAYDMVSSRSDFDFSDYKMRGTLMAEELAEIKYGKSFDDLDQKTQMDLYEQSSDYLNDVAADRAEDMRDMMKERFDKAEGGLMDTRQAYGFGSFVKSITKPIKKGISKIGDVVKDIDLEDAAAIAAIAMGVPPPVVGATYGAAGGDNPLVQAYTAFGQPGGGFSFAPQSGGFPGTGSGQQFGLADALRIGTRMYGLPGSKDDAIYEEQVYEPVPGQRTTLPPYYPPGTEPGQEPSGITKIIIDQLKKITGKDVAAGAAGAAAAKLSFEDRKRLIEQIEKDIKQQRADVAMFKERFKNIRGTGRATGAPTGPADVVRRPGQAMGGIMDVPLRTNPQGVTEMDFRKTGGFVPPVGIKEKADDIPAMLSNNEFVFTADAVRAAGGGSVNKGAQKMYSLMKQLEGQA
jgi:hypothetical protein